MSPSKDFIFGAVRKHWGVLHGYRPYKIKWSWGFYSSHSTGFFIKTESATWRQELHMQKKEIINKINKKIGSIAIKEIRFI